MILETIIYSAVAIFIAWIWMHYFLLIDIFQKEKLSDILLVYALGGASVLFVFFIQDNLFPIISLTLNGNALNDFMFSTIQVGMLEETAKLMAFVVFFAIRKQVVDEPIDFLIYLCVSALGFSTVENVLYFKSYGPELISGRSILSTVGHMFDTALIAYGIILYKFKPSRKNAGIVVLYFIYAALSHGFYDFWLMHEPVKRGGWIITYLYFMLTISFFAVILNNAINNSSLFSYKNTINPNKVSLKIIGYYMILLLIQLIIVSAKKGFETGFAVLIGSVFISGFIIFITALRLSRFKLIQNMWHPIKFELPFSIISTNSAYASASLLGLTIKGDSYNETRISSFYNEDIYLCPLSKKRSKLERARKVYVEGKLFLKNYDSVYTVRFYDSDISSEQFFIKAKKSGKSFSPDGNPIVALLKCTEEFIDEDMILTDKDFRLIEWAVARIE